MVKSKVYIKEISDLVKIQKISFCYFLKIGIFKELQKFSIIDSLQKKQTIKLKYKFSEIYKKIESKQYFNDKYSISIYVLFYKKTFNKFKYLGKKLLCELPLMTPRGTFIINGCEQALISQILRSPGLYFSKLEISQSKIATLIPNIGPWLIFEFDKEGLIWIRTPNSLKIPLFTFLSTSLIKYKYLIKTKYPFINNYLSIFKKIIGKRKNLLKKSTPLFEFFKNENNFFLGNNGRYHLNKSLNRVSNSWCLEIEDILSIIQKLILLENTDNIDDLDNRYIKDTNTLFKECLSKGLLRFKLQLQYLYKIENRIENWFNFNSKKNISFDNNQPLIKTFTEFFNTSNLSQYLDQTNDLAESIHQRRITCFGSNGLKRTNVSLNIRDIQHTFFGKLCPIETSEGQNVGLTMSLATDVNIDSNGFLNNYFYKINKKKLNSRNILLNSHLEKNYFILFENNFVTTKNKLLNKNYLLKKDKEFDNYALSKIDYVIKSPFQIFSPSLLLIPFLEHNDASRALMGANMYKQAVPIINSEKPIINTGFEIEVGNFANHNIISYSKGVVINIFSNQIIIKDIYKKIVSYYLNKFKISNQKTLIIQKAIVSVGQKINYGQILADSSSLSQGELSLGKNLTVAYLSWKGYNFEDAIVINERLIKENLFDSIHLDLLTVELNQNERFDFYQLVDNRKKILFSSNPLFIKDSYFGYKFDEKTTLYLEIKPKINLINQLFNDDFSKKQNTIKKFEKFSGYIFDIKIIRTKKGTNIFQFVFGKKLKLEIGDKISGRHGNKGVISKIIPSSEMPTLKDGTPIDVLLNPLGIPSRMNIGQIFETLLGLTGNRFNKRFKIFSFDELYNKNASELLINHNFVKMKKKDNDFFYNYRLIGKQIIRNNKTGLLFDNPVLVGKSYILKLIHLVDKKIHARDIGPYQQLTQQPPRGKSMNGGQRFGEMEVWALEAHGVMYNLREFLTIKSDNSENRKFLYNSIKQMKKFPGINIPDVFKVLTKQLNALGLSVSLYGFNFNNFNSKKLTFDMNSKSKVNSSIKYKKQAHRVSFPYSTL